MMHRQAFLICLFAAPSALADFEAPSASPPPSASSPSQRPWDLSVRFAVGHNNNVQLVPDVTTFPADGKTAANYFLSQANGVYRFYNSDKVTSGLTLGVSSLWHEDKLQSVSQNWKFDDYDFYTFNPGIYSSYRHSLSGNPAALTFSYSYLKEDGHNEDLAALGLSSHNIVVAESIALNRDLVLTATLSLGWDDFEVRFPANPTMNRDGNRSGIDVGVRYWMGEGLHNVSANIGYINNDAKGADFKYDGYNLRLRFESGALQPVWLAAEVKYSDRDYNANAPLGRDYQRITTTQLQALWPISPHWSADLYYKNDQYDSNLSNYETDANQYGVGISYKF